MGLPLLAFLLFEAFETAQGLISPLSKPTSPAENQPDGVNGWTPKTTQPPRLHGYGLYGAMATHELLKRGSSSSFTGVLDTCGWYNADGDTPLTCVPNYACAYITKPSPKWFACCPTTSGTIDWPNCPYYSICYPFDSYSAPNTWTGSYEYAPDGTTSFFCPSQQPYCNTILLTNQVSSTYQHMYCDTTSSTWDVLQFIASSSGSSPASGSGPSPSSSSPAPMSVPHQPSVQTVTVTKSGGHAGGQNAGSSSSASSSPTGHKHNKSSTNVGAIAGGVVGGVAGIALIGAAVGYLIYRKRKARVEPMREVSIYSQNYPNSNGGQSSGYNNGNIY